jgi:glycosyltransferase involved in cell wall biosynthesis
MKILTVRSTLPDMGPGTQPLTIAKMMRELGHETIFASAGGDYLPNVLDAGFHVELIPELSPAHHNPLSIATAVAKLRRLIANERPDMIHGHNAAATICASFAGFLAGRKIPCATSVRGVEERASHQWRNSIWKRTPGILLGVCEKTRERLIAFGCPPSKIAVTYNGIDPRRFDPDAPNDREMLREQFGLAGKLVVGCTGAMTGPDNLQGPGKGQHLLVHAAAMLKDECPNLAVLLIGDGPARHKVEQVVRDTGMEDRVIFAGQRFDVPKLLPVMDIYCLPSIYGEFFPNSIIEAMCMRLPWVGSDIAGLSELTAEGAAGWVSPVGEVEALANNLRRLATTPNLRKKMGAEGRKEVLSRFTIEIVGERILSAYKAAGLRTKV